MGSLASKLDSIAKKNASGGSYDDPYRKKTAEEKTIDFYVPEAKQKEIELEQTSTVEDILSFIDNINRPMYAVAGALRSSIGHAKKKLNPQWQEAQEEKSFGERLSGEVKETGETIKAAWKGLTREERYTSRDVVRKIAPETLKAIEEKTKVKPFGIEADAASVPLFVADIAIDPLTYVPFGAIVSVGKEFLGVGGKAMSKTAARVIGEAAVEKISTKYKKPLVEGINQLFNQRGIWKERGIAPLLDNYITKKEAALGKAEKFGIESSRVAAGMEMTSKIRMVGEDGAKQIHEAMHGAADEAAQVYGDLFAKDVGISTESIGRMKEVHELVEKMGMSETAAQKTAIAREISEKMGDKKGELLGMISEGVIEDRAIKKFVNKLSRSELDASLMHVDAEFKTAKDLFFESKKGIESKIAKLHGALKSDLKMTGKLLTDEVAETGRAMRGLDNELSKWMTGASDDMVGGVKGQFGLLKNRINSLNKYMMAEGSQLGRPVFDTSKVTKEMIRSAMKGAAPEIRDELKRLLRIKSMGRRAGASGLDTSFAKAEKAILENPKIVEAIGKIEAHMPIAKSFDSFSSIKKSVAELEQAIGRAEIGSVREISSETAQAMRQKLRSLNGDLKRFRNLRRVEIDRLGMESRATTELNQQLFKSYKDELTALTKDKDQLFKQFAVKATQRKDAVKALSDAARINSGKYYKAFRALNGGRYWQEFLGKHAAEKEQIWGKWLEKLPEELREPASKLRTMYDEYGKMGYESGYLKGTSVLYAPRKIQDDFLEQVTQKVSPFKQGGKSFLKGREFKTYNEFKEFVTSQGGKVEDDAIVLGMDYVKKFEMDYAKHNLTQAVLAKYGKDYLMEKLAKVGDETFDTRRISSSVIRQGLDFAKKEAPELEGQFQKLLQMRRKDPFSMAGEAAKAERGILQNPDILKILKKVDAPLTAIGDIKDVGMQKSLKWLFSEGWTKHENTILERAWKAYGGVLNAAKKSLTVINPAFHGRNILGFPFLAATTAGIKHGWNPVNYADAIAVSLGKEGKITSKIGEFTYEAIRKAQEDSGYWASSFTRGDMKRAANAILGRYKPYDPRRWMSELLNYTQKIEDTGRTGALIANLKSGKTMDEALKAAKEAMFDYNLINSPADKALQGIFGFYSFSRRNLPMQIKTLFNDPKQYAILSRALDRVSNRENLTDEEMGLLSTFDNQSFKIFGEAVDGVRHFTSLGFFPVEEAYQTLNAITGRGAKGDLLSFEGLKERFRILGGRVNPIATSFLDYYYGKESFYGQDFGNYLPEKYARIIPDGLADVLGLTKKTKEKWRGGEVVGTEEVLYGDPDTIFMIRRLPFTSRIVGEMATLVDNVKKGKVAEGTLGFTMNIRGKELDVAKAKKNLQRRIDEAKKREAKKGGAATFENVYIPGWQQTDVLKKKKWQIKQQKGSMQGGE